MYDIEYVHTVLMTMSRCPLVDWKFTNGNESFVDFTCCYMYDVLKAMIFQSFEDWTFVFFVDWTCC
jgi:hypothetical protein